MVAITYDFLKTRPKTTIWSEFWTCGPKSLATKASKPLFREPLFQGPSPFKNIGNVPGPSKQTTKASEPLFTGPL